MRRTRLARTITLALIVVAAAPAAATASSLVYIKDSNVWIANPDGTGAYQVTLDGTAADPYSAPSQANDGALLAIKGSGPSAQFHHLRQNGDLIDPPFAHSAPAHPHDAQLSPDGTLVAYHWVGITSGCYYGCYDANPKTFFSYSNRFTPGEEITNDVNFQNPTWMSNSRVFLSYGASLTFTYNLGDDDATQWFANSDTTVYDPDLDASNSRFVVIGNRDSGNPETLRFFATTGPPPAEPALMPCYITNPTGGAFDDPTFAPDGSAVAWAEGDGIWNATIGDYGSSDCTAAFTGGGLIVPGGSEPDWGPADVNPGPRTQPASGGGSPPPAGGTTGPAPTGTGPGSTDAAARFGFAFVGRRTLASLLASGLRFSINCPGPCDVSGQLRYKGAKVASGRKTLLQAGPARVAVKVSKAGKRRLRRLRRAKVTLKVSITEPASTSELSKSFTLRR